MSGSGDGAARVPAAQVPALTLQLHPDWPHQHRTVIESMARAGVYLSQFATGISNGALDGISGDRRTWESRLFGGRYDDAPGAERPVYGAWNRGGDPYGGSVRFGSCYVRLRPEVVERATFCYPDSTYEQGRVVGPDGLALLCGEADRADTDDLDDYVEAHVHGPVRFDRDVDALVLDPCYAGTGHEAAARRLGCAVEWHPGFRVVADSLDPRYRGVEVIDLARRLGPVLTPDVVGEAARSDDHDPRTLKRVWHCVARFGRAR